jgi:hypothetical protein
VIAEAQISYAGPGALARAELALNILKRRLAGSNDGKLRFDLIGLNAIHGSAAEHGAPYEIRLRSAGRFKKEVDAKNLVREMESLYLNGPAAGCGVTFSVRESIAIVPALIARELVTTSFFIEEA